MNKRFFMYTLFFCMAFFLYGCNEIAYYYQATAGQMQILAARKSIDALLKDPTIDQKQKKCLQNVLLIRSFAIDSLKLPENGSYTTLVDLNRKYVVWNLYAAREFSIDPEKWCFPFAGCVPYKGYFDKKKAETLLNEFRQNGYDVYLAPVPAYSTLGWFDDPLYSTLLGWPEESLAGLIFHELAHALLYVKNDAVFNESFATSVEYEGIRRWMEQKGVPEKFDLFVKRKELSKEVVALILSMRNDLDSLYKKNFKKAEKLKMKKEMFEQLTKQYEKMKKDRPDESKGWDRWFSKGLNNAKMASISTYNKYLPAFSNLLKKTDGNLDLFYKTAKEIAALPKSKREEKMKELL